MWPAQLRVVTLVRGAALLGLALVTACTSSRAEILWREGWVQENKGDLSAAARRYEESASRDGRQVGARLNQIRLLLVTPEGKADGQELLDKLLKSHASEPNVAAFAATWALSQGQLPQAQQRLGAMRPLKSSDEATTQNAVHIAQLRVACAEGAWPKAWDLAQDSSPTATDAILRATAAYETGHLDEAIQLLAVSPDNQERRILQVLIATRQGQPDATLEALGRVPPGAMTPVLLAAKAQAYLALHRPAEAVGLAADAARQQSDRSDYSELWAVALLESGQAAPARDILAGWTVRGGGWTVWYHLGLAYLRLGDGQQSAAAFAGAAARCPTCAPVQQNLAALKRMGW